MRPSSMPASERSGGEHPRPSRGAQRTDRRRIRLSLFTSKGGAVPLHEGNWINGAVTGAVIIEVNFVV